MYNKLIKNEAVVDLAKEWIGTPYHKKGYRKGSGADCFGLILGVWYEIFRKYPIFFDEYSEDLFDFYDKNIIDYYAKLIFIKDQCIDISPGTILAFRVKNREDPRQLGIVSDCSYFANFIHSYHGYGVVESPLSRPWYNRIYASYKFPLGE